MYILMRFETKERRIGMRLGPVLLLVFGGIVAVSFVMFLLNTAKLFQEVQPLIRKIDRMKEVFLSSEE